MQVEAEGDAGRLVAGLTELARAAETQCVVRVALAFVMDELDVDADTAARHLTRWSHERAAELDDIARGIVQTGQLPDQPWQAAGTPT